MEFRSRHRFPVLETDRLKLRELNAEDAPFIHFMRSDPTVNQYIDRPRSKSREDAMFFIEQRQQDFFHKKAIYWIISLKTNGFSVGAITLWNLDLDEGTGEIGYELHPSFLGKGYMSEAMNKVLAFGFGLLQLGSITAITSPNNTRSVELLTRKNFHRIPESELSEIDFEAGLAGYRLVNSRHA